MLIRALSFADCDVLCFLAQNQSVFEDKKGIARLQSHESKTVYNAFCAFSLDEKPVSTFSIQPFIIIP